MADDFDAAEISWWSTARTSSSSNSFEGSAGMAAAASASCSAAIVDVVSGPLIDSSTLQVSGFGMDWNQSLLRSSSSSTARADQPSFHSMLQEPLNYQEQFLIDQHQQQQVQQQVVQNQQQQPGLSMMLQGMFETTEAKPIFDQRSLNYQAQAQAQAPSMTMMMMGSGSNFPHQFLKSSPPKQQQQASTASSHLQFSNNTAFWNASPMPVQFGTSNNQSYDQKPASCSSLITKSNSDSTTVQKRSGSGGSSGSSEPALMKKTRMETPSPLPTFKVRKEKLGDRITALQQLVSPFGKTDTASVLHEAIDYIKFLHDQVSVLSTPYLKNGHPMQHQQSSDKSKDGEGPKQDLRSRGLCLVPIESTYPVASETMADFWTPTFGGSYR